MTVSQERELVTRTVSLLDSLDEVEEVEPSVRANPRSHRILEEMRRMQVRALPALRISAAAEVLGVTEPTVRLWTDEGLLQEVERHPVRRVSAQSVLRVRPIVTALRRHGRKRNLLEAIFAQLSDELQLEADGLQESLEQMRRGEIIDITPAQ